MAISVPYDVKAILGGILAFILFAYYIYVVARSSSRRLAPEAAGGWPIVGHFPLLGGPDLPHVTLGALADKYGPAFRIRLGMRQVLVVSGWEVAKECLTTNDVAVSDRPETIARKHLGLKKANFGMAPYGPYWREMRKITATELLSSRRLELLRHVRSSEMGSFLKELYELWKKGQKDGVVLVELKERLGDLNLNVILRMIAGRRYSGEDPESRRCQRVLSEFFRLMGQFPVGDSVPFLRWLDLGGHEKAMKKVARELDGIMSGWLEEHRRRRDSGGHKDFMDVMLSGLEGVAHLGGFDPDTINKATAMTLIAGGSDTSTIVATWAFSLLLNHPHVLKKGQEELDIHVGKDRIVEESDIRKLTYLQAIVKEVLRLHPPGAVVAGRVFSEDCTVSGYHVPAGTRLIINLSKLQRDPRVWSNPLEFKPERFLEDEHKGVDVVGKNFELIPFGAGRRACPGAAFGMLMAQVTVARLLQAFDISTPGNAPVDMTAIAGMTVSKCTPLEVLIAPRLAEHLY